MCQTEIVWHISLIAAARDLHSGLAEPLRRVVTVPRYGPRRRRSSSIHTSGGKSYLWR